MKYFLLSGLALMLSACSQSPEKQSASVPPVSADTVKQEKAVTPEPVTLLGTWEAKVEPIEDQPATEWEIRFIDNGRYQSFYKPSNRKNGTWYLHTDTLSLHTIAIDNFKVLESNDTLLKIKALDKRGDEYTFRKTHGE